MISLTGYEYYEIVSSEDKVQTYTGVEVQPGSPGDSTLFFDSLIGQALIEHELHEETTYISYQIDSSILQDKRLEVPGPEAPFTLANLVAAKKISELTQIRTSLLLAGNILFQGKKDIGKWAKCLSMQHGCGLGTDIDQHLKCNIKNKRTRDELRIIIRKFKLQLYDE